MNNEGITREELSQLLSKPQTESVHPYEVIIDSSFLPRSKRHRKKKKQLFRPQS